MNATWNLEKNSKKPLKRERRQSLISSPRRKNGEVFPTHHTISLLTDHDGQTIGIVSVVRDMSERKTS